MASFSAPSSELGDFFTGPTRTNVNELPSHFLIESPNSPSASHECATMISVGFFAAVMMVIYMKSWRYHEIQSILRHLQFRN